MVSGKKNILYFYLIKKLSRIIPTEENKGIAQREPSRSRRSVVLRKIGVAALTTLFVYEAIVYMNVGRIGFSFSVNELKELSLAFVFLLSIFFAHGRISRLMNQPYFRTMSRFPKSLLEMLIVITSTLLIFLVTNYIPLLLLFGAEALLPVRVRTAFVAGTFISLFFYYFVERERHKRQLHAQLLHSAKLQKENYRAQLESLKNQVQPHFLFNSLNVLRTLINRDQEKATEFTQRLSDVYRSFLAYGDDPLIPLKKELEVAEAYIYLLETRFGKAIQIELKIPKESLDYYLPPGALQTLIENAIKHNGSTSKNPLRVNIHTHKGKLIVRNHLSPRRENTVSTKTGLKNLKTRYGFLTDKEVTWEKTQTEFIVRLPLVKIENHEDRYN